MKTVVAYVVALSVVCSCWAYESYNEAVNDLNALSVSSEGQMLFANISREIDQRVQRYGSEIQTGFSDESISVKANTRLMKDLTAILTRYETQIKHALRARK